VNRERHKWNMVPTPAEQRATFQDLSLVGSLDDMARSIALLIRCLLHCGGNDDTSTSLSTERMTRGVVVPSII